jgi:hypothetical protein
MMLAARDRGQREEYWVVTVRQRPKMRGGLSAIVLGVAVIATATGCAHPAAPATSEPAGTSAPAQRVEVHYANGAVQGGVSRVPVRLGSPVTLVVTSDIADEVHLHGYDRKVDVPAGGVASLDFVANQAGVFEAELESRGTQLVQLEVR